MIKGIIFDLDGTLIDSMTAWDNVGRDFLLSQGITPPPGLDDRLKVMSFTQSSRFFIEEFHLSMSVSQVMDYLYSVVEHRYKDTIPEKKNANALLKRLREQGLSLCVATATALPLATAALKRLGMFDKIDFILTCDELGTGKDQPDIYHQATEKMGLCQNEVVIVEDTLHCVKTAKSAGYQVIGVYDQSSDSDTEQMKELCDCYVDGFDPLDRFLDKIKTVFDFGD
jgi:HAD superfamily hydrolase (TIGR01509 family)